MRVFARAGALYQTARFAGQISRLLSRLAGRPDHLMEASEILPDEITAPHYSGLQTVRIHEIMASEGRNRDFDRAFHPLRDGRQGTGMKRDVRWQIFCVCAGK